MTNENYKEYSILRREYLKTDYSDRVLDQIKFQGDNLVENRFKVQLEPIQELDDSYSDEFLRLYYAPSNERFNVESKLNVFGIGKGSYEDHEKMAIVYKKNPKNIEDKLKNI